MAENNKHPGVRKIEEFESLLTKEHTIPQLEEHLQGLKDELDRPGAFDEAQKTAAKIIRAKIKAIKKDYRDVVKKKEYLRAGYLLRQIEGKAQEIIEAGESEKRGGEKGEVSQKIQNKLNESPLLVAVFKKDVGAVNTFGAQEEKIKYDIEDEEGLRRAVNRAISELRKTYLQLGNPPQDSLNFDQVVDWLSAGNVDEKGINLLSANIHIHLIDQTRINEEIKDIRTEFTNDPVLHAIYLKDGEERIKEINEVGAIYDEDNRFSVSSAESLKSAVSEALRQFKTEFNLRELPKNPLDIETVCAWLQKEKIKGLNLKALVAHIENNLVIETKKSSGAPKKPVPEKSSEVLERSVPEETEDKKLENMALGHAKKEFREWTSLFNAVHRRNLPDDPKIREKAIKNRQEILGTTDGRDYAQLRNMLAKTELNIFLEPKTNRIQAMRAALGTEALNERNIGPALTEKLAEFRLIISQAKEQLKANSPKAEKVSEKPVPVKADIHTFEPKKSEQKEPKPVEGDKLAKPNTEKEGPMITAKRTPVEMGPRNTPVSERAAIQGPNNTLKALVEKLTPENRLLYANAVGLLQKDTKEIKDPELVKQVKKQLGQIEAAFSSLGDVIDEARLSKLLNTQLLPLSRGIQAELSGIAPTPEAPKARVEKDGLPYEEKKEMLLGLASISDEFKELENGLEKLYSILEIKKEEVEDNKKLAIHLAKIQELCRIFLDGINAKKLSEMPLGEELKKEMLGNLEKYNKGVKTWIDGFKLKRPETGSHQASEPSKPTEPTPTPTGTPASTTPQVPGPGTVQAPNQTPPAISAALINAQPQTVEEDEEEIEEGLGELDLAKAVTEACLADKSQFKVNDPACRALERLLKEDNGLNMEDLIKYLKNPTLHNKNVATKEEVEALLKNYKANSIENLLKKLEKGIEDQKEKIVENNNLINPTGTRGISTEDRNKYIILRDAAKTERDRLTALKGSIEGYEKKIGGIETYKSPKELLGQVLQYINRENDQFNPMEAAIQLDQRIENEMGIESYEGARKYLARALLVLRPTLGATLKAFEKDPILSQVDDKNAAEKLGELASCGKKEDVIHWLEGLKKRPDGKEHMNSTVPRLIAFLELGIREGISSNVFMDGAAKAKELVKHLRSIQREAVLQQVEKDFAGKPNLEKFKEYCRKLNDLEVQNNHVSSKILKGTAWASGALKAGSALGVGVLTYGLGFAMLPAIAAAPAIMASYMSKSAIPEDKREMVKRGGYALAIANGLAVVITPWTLLATVPFGALAALKPEWAKGLGNAALWPIKKIFKKGDKKELAPTNPPQK